MAPRAKHFIWLLFKGELKTADFLHALNIGPQEFCTFCWLIFETTEHILNLCPKTQAIWNDVSNLVRKNVSFPDGFVSGLWIEADYSVYSNYVKSVVVAIAWLIWKAHCNAGFRNEIPDLGFIPRKAYALVQEYSTASNHQKGKNHPY